MRRYSKCMVITHTDMNGWYKTTNTAIAIITEGTEWLEAWERLSEIWANVLDECDDLIQKSNGQNNHYEMLKNALNKFCSNEKYTWRIVADNVDIQEI